MADTVFYREIVQGMVNSSVKGLYHEDSERPISEDCFGDWMDVELGKLGQYKDKLFDDFWTITMSDATDVANIFINGHYKNFEACQFERIQDDKKNWCLNNADKCVGLSGIFDNLYDNGPALFSRILDIYDLLTIDDICYSDSELISEVERGTEDVISIISSVWGFDLKWDPSRQVTHIKRKDFREQIYAKNIGWGDDLSLPDWDDIWGIIEGIELPSIGTLIQYIEEALQYIGLY